MFRARRGNEKLVVKIGLTHEESVEVNRNIAGYIVTGKWTGDAPRTEKIASLRKAIPTFPILVGSGVDAKNAHQLFRYANGAMVSTSLKQGPKNSSEVNMKTYGQRIAIQKVRRLVATL